MYAYLVLCVLHAAGVRLKTLDKFVVLLCWLR